jgi:hypothetical protein
MATLSSISSVIPKAMDMAEGYAESDPLLEQIRQKRMEREEQDRKNSETQALNDFRKASAEVEQMKLAMDASTRTKLAGFTPIDNSSAQNYLKSVRARLTEMHNSGNPDIMALGEKMWAQVPNVLKMMQSQAGGSTMGMDQMQTDIDKGYWEGQKAKSEAGYLDSLGRTGDKAPAADKFSHKAVGEYLKAKGHSNLFGTPQQQAHIQQEAISIADAALNQGHQLTFTQIMDLAFNKVANQIPHGYEGQVGGVQAPQSVIPPGWGSK